MVAMRRFQDLMRMLACQSSPSMPTTNTSPMNNKSTQTPELQRQMKNQRTFIPSPNYQQRRLNLNSTVGNTFQYHQQHQEKIPRHVHVKLRKSDNKPHEIYSKDETLFRMQHHRNICSTAGTNCSRNYNISNRIYTNKNCYSSCSRRTSPVTNQRSNYTYNNNFNQDKTVIKKPVEGNNNNNERPSTLFGRSNSIKTPPVKDHKFSKYAPLPAISTSENNNNNLVVNRTPALDIRRRNTRRLNRQLTYKVLNPLFVKGPSDCQNYSSFKSSEQSVKFKNNSRGSTPNSTRSIHRSSTVIIRKNKGSVKPKKIDISDVGNKSLSYMDLPVRDVDNEEIKGKISRSVHGNRLTVKKKLIEAAEKIKEGENITDNAFWVQF